MKEMYLLDCNWGDNNDSILETTHNTAVCVVPPDDAWDTIQRARHMARDVSLYRWPPAIRLFHPFAPRPYLASAASAIADLIDEQKLEPFEITLDNLVIRPDHDALEGMVREEDQYEEDEEEEEEEMDEIQQLIQNEEVKGRDRYLRRIRKLREEGKLKGNDSEQEEDNNTTSESQSSPSSPTYEYNGPCIITLEPNEESQDKLHTLHNLLSQHLFGNQSNTDTNTTTSFRPGIPLGTFSTTHQAVVMARKLQELWEPLTFDVTDIHMISCQDTDDRDSNAVLQQEHLSLSTNQMECDAMVMLYGEDIVPSIDDQEKDDLLMSLLFRQGEEGGGASALDMKDTTTTVKEERHLQREEEEEEDNSLSSVFFG